MKLKKVKKFLSLVNYTEGTCFGELALQYGQPRGASIYAKRNSYLMVIDKEDYDNYLAKYQKKLRDALVEQFKYVPFL